MSIFLAIAKTCNASTSNATMSVNYYNSASASGAMPTRDKEEDRLNMVNPEAESKGVVKDEELDFMSDEFLVECSKNDVRPGLLMKHSDKRRHELMKKQEIANETSKVKNKPLRQLEEETREKCLNTQIGSDNKGFQLLQKMGYKPGTSIGRNQESESALKEPIPIVLKRNRLGLGEKTKTEKKKQKMNEWKEHLEQLSDPNEYRNRIQANKANQQIERDLKKAQSCCQTLDLRNNKQQPTQQYFWPELPKDAEDEEDLDEQEQEENNEDIVEIPVQYKLSHLVEYLRDQYFYCIWCGAEYDDADDFSRNCPGPSRDDH